MVAREFAKRYADKGIVSTSLNPGMMLYMVYTFLALTVSIRRKYRDRFTTLRLAAQT